jgi:hypothetical protein
MFQDREVVTAPSPSREKRDKLRGCKASIGLLHFPYSFSYSFSFLL